MLALGKQIMAKPKAELLTKVVELCRTHGFVLESMMELNGVRTRVYDYGPLGTEMRRALRDRWWKFMVTAREDVVGVESSLVGRLPQWYGGAPTGDGVVPPPTLDNSETRSLTSGLFQSTCYQSALAQRSMGLELPFGIAQIGKCFEKTSEDSQDDENFLLRPTESEKMTINYFFSNDNEKMNLIDHWEKQRLQWWKSMANFSRKFTSSAPMGESLIEARDIQISLPWGAQTVETIRQTNNLDGCPVQDWQMQNHNGYPIEVIEMTTSLDTALLAFLLDAYEETLRPTSTGELKEKKVMHIHSSIAPIKVAVITPADTHRAEVFQVGKYLAKELRNAGMNTHFINSITDIEELYAQQDEMGTPFAVTIFEETFNNGVVNLRNRDTSLEEQVHIDDVLQTLKVHLDS